MRVYILFLTEFISSSSSWSLTSDWSSTYVTWLFSLCTSTNLSSIACLLSSNDRSLSIKSYNRHYLWNIASWIIKYLMQKIVRSLSTKVRTYDCVHELSFCVQSYLQDCPAGSLFFYCWHHSIVYLRFQFSVVVKNVTEKEETYLSKCRETWAESFVEEVYEKSIDRRNK